MIGEIISHYRITAELGSGGMGIVYRAIDQRLGREVAIKFLPVTLAEDPFALARFDREARVASSLNHPNICTVHDVDQHDGRPFIVMELCPGRTVKQLIQADGLTLPLAMEIAIQTAAALEAAHQNGVVHRDVKPANLMISDSGLVKVLDFGLAKHVRAQWISSPDDSAGSSTGVPSVEVTSPGIRVGTIAYMSPEQAQAQPLDARSDLFSLGTVIYEMVTRQRPFVGEAPGVVLDGLLHRPPTPLRALNPAVPAALETVVERALQKAPDVRYQTATELLADLHRVRRQLGPSRPESQAAGAAGALSTSPAEPGRRRRSLVFAAALLAATAGAGLIGLRDGVPPLSERDGVLIAGLENRTGESVFDGTLSQALAVQLAQSPFLNPVPDDRVREALRWMGRPPEERPVGEVAREVCQRLGLKALVDGSLSRLGNLYVLMLDARACDTGVSLAREQGSAPSQQDVLGVLGRLTSTLRARLGESLKSVQQFDVPIAQASTPSLDALKAYTLGLAERARGAELESIPFFARALELDPQFASAAATLSTVYGNLGEGARADQYGRLAYDHRERVSERERFFITYQYFDRVIGDEPRAAETLEMWARTYPGDFRPRNALAIIHNRLGRYERGVEEATAALNRSRGHPFPLSNLAYAYRGLGRFTEAKQTAEEAVRLGVETVPTRRLLYQIAVLEGDAEGAARHLAWGKGKAREFDLVAAEGQVFAYEGRVRDAAARFRRAIELAEQRSLAEAAASVAAQAALVHAIYGYRDQAVTFARRAIAPAAEQASSASTNPRLRAVVALGLLGRPEATNLAEMAAERYPSATLTQSILVPSARAAVALAQGRSADSVLLLRPTEEYELGSWASLIPVYLRGLAYLQNGSGDEALQQFQRIEHHRGADPHSPVCAVAPLGAARALRLAGRAADSLEAYQRFFDRFRRADDDLPVLRAARTEYDRLRSQPGSTP